MVSAVVLAAGSGTRLGIPKALAHLEGLTLVELVVETCVRALVDEVVVVTGARAEEVERLVAVRAARSTDVPLRAVRNRRWSQGRMGSVQAGWKACPPGAHALIFPVDHPAVSASTVETLLGTFGHATGQPRVVVPTVGTPEGHRRGHPILLAAALREEALECAEAAPLHDLVRRHPVLEVPVDDEGIIINVDTPQDLERARLARARVHASS